jgi:predicted MFS family arabinose efflux permease
MSGDQVSSKHPSTLANEVLYLARIAQSIGASLTWLSAYAIVADLSPEDKRDRSFGRLVQELERSTVSQQHPQAGQG